MKKRGVLQRQKYTKFFFAVLCLCGLFLFSCSKIEEKIPADIISKDTMVQIMVDIHMAEARSQFNVAFDNKKNVKQAYYKFIFEKYKISYVELTRSWDFYSTHPDIFAKVYEDVITELSKKQAAGNDSILPK